MEFQFGTNGRVRGSRQGRATRSRRGLFAFFLESSFPAAVLASAPGPRVHPRPALFIGTWLSGYFIIVTNAFMQHPVGHAILPDGTLGLADFGAFLFNPWAIAAYAHNMCASVVTASFVMSAVGAYYVLRSIHVEHGRRFLAVGVWAGLIASLLVAFPTGDHQGKLLARRQPVALAAMEGRFQSGPYAEITLIGQPNVRERRLDNPIHVPGALSFLSFGTFHAEVAGLEQLPVDWPDNIELLYYAFHVGRSRDVDDRADGALRLGTRAREADAEPPAVVGADAGLPVSLYRHHRRLDDRRARTAAVAGVRDPPHGRGREPDRPFGHGAVHAHRLLRAPVLGPLFLFLVTRGGAGPGAHG
jgi:hypothetical protein